MKDSHKSLRAMIEAVTELASVVQELDPGKVATYERVAAALGKARKHLVAAEAFERR